MPLISAAVVGAYAFGVPIVFTDDADDDTTLALATALACNITWNGVPVSSIATDLHRWWLTDSDVSFAPLD